MLIDMDQFQMRRLAEDAALDPRGTALIIIDMMNLFCDPVWLAGGSEEGARYFAAELPRAASNIHELLQACRDTGALVAHVINGRWTPEGREVAPYQRAWEHGCFDTAPLTPIESLAPQPGEIIVRKVASCAFTATGLEYMLRNAGITNVIIAGQFGSACCLYSLIHSREAGFDSIWAEDAIVYASEQYKQALGPIIGASWATIGETPPLAEALRRSVRAGACGCSAPPPPTCEGETAP